MVQGRRVHLIATSKHNTAPAESPPISNMPPYSRSFTARSFVPHYAQHISTACVMHANGILKTKASARKEPPTSFRRASACA